MIHCRNKTGYRRRLGHRQSIPRCGSPASAPRLRAGAKPRAPGLKLPGRSARPRARRRRRRRPWHTRRAAGAPATDAIRTPSGSGSSATTAPWCSRADHLPPARHPDPGRQHVGLGRDHTLFALASGQVAFASPRFAPRRELPVLRLRRGPGPARRVASAPDSSPEGGPGPGPPFSGAGSVKGQGLPAEFLDDVTLDVSAGPGGHGAPQPPAREIMSRLAVPTAVTVVVEATSCSRWTRARPCHPRPFQRRRFAGPPAGRARAPSAAAPTARTCSSRCPPGPRSRPRTGELLGDLSAPGQAGGRRRRRGGRGNAPPRDPPRPPGRARASRGSSVTSSSS